MPAVSGRGGRRRRMVNEINVVPYIDVMLVLLVIFMVTAPMIQTGTVDVPSVGSRTNAPPGAYAEVVVRERGPMRLALRGAPGGSTDGDEVRADALADAVQALRASSGEVPVVISGEKGVRYEAVIGVLDTLRRAGVDKVGLMVKPQQP